MASYESLIGQAILGDAAARAIAEDKITVKMAVTRAITCPYTGAILDERTAVVLENTDTGAIGAIMSPAAFDAVRDHAAVLEVLRTHRVIDARALHRRAGKNC